MFKSILAFILAITTVTTQAYGAAPIGAGPMCGELFRSTPHLEKLFTEAEVLSELSSFGYSPTQSQLLKAAEADVLGNVGISGRTKNWVSGWFSLLRLNGAKRDKVLVEIHRRRYENALGEIGIKPERGVSAIVKTITTYSSVALTIGLNIGVNYISFKYLNKFIPVGVPIPSPSRIFKPSAIPNDVLSEMLEPSADQPRTRSFISERLLEAWPATWKALTPEARKATLRAYTQTVLTTAIRYLNVFLLTTMLIHTAPVARDLIAVRGDINAYMGLQMERMADGLHDGAIAQNLKTLEIVRQKRARFVREGNQEKIEKADQLIRDIEDDIARLRSEDKK